MPYKDTEVRKEYQKKYGPKYYSENRDSIIAYSKKRLAENKYAGFCNRLIKLFDDFGIETRGTAVFAKILYDPILLLNKKKEECRNCHEVKILNMYSFCSKDCTHKFHLKAKREQTHLAHNIPSYPAHKASLEAKKTIAYLYAGSKCTRDLEYKEKLKQILLYIERGYTYEAYV